MPKMKQISIRPKTGKKFKMAKQNNLCYKTKKLFESATYLLTAFLPPRPLCEVKDAQILYHT